MKKIIIFILFGFTCLPAFAQLDAGICQGFKVIDGASAPDIINISIVDLGDGRTFSGNADNKKPLDGKYHLILDNGKYSIVNFKKGILDGDWALYWNGNDVEAKGSFKNGKRDGIFVANDADIYGGHAEITYQNGVVQHERNWHSNGKLEADINFDENGNIDGEVIKYDENGNIAARKNYSHGKREGLQMQKDDYGYTQTYTMKNGIKTGSYCERYPNGNIKDTGAYDEHENPVGTWYSFEKNGDTVDVAHYGDNGNRYLKFYANGKLREYSELANGAKNGKYIKYSTQPPYRILVEATYKNNMPDGDVTMYDNNGALLNITTYDNGNLVLEKYYQNGKLFRMKKPGNDGFLEDVPIPATGQKTAATKTTPTRKPASQKPPPKLKQDASGIIDVQR